MNEPLISVYIPTKNRSDLLHRAVSSVLVQTYNNFEVIVVDDGSTDNTNDVVLELSKRSKNIIYLKNNRSKGACYCRNLAIKNAKGRYVTGLDDDDFFDENRLQDFVINLKYHDLIFSGCKVITTKKNKIIHRNRKNKYVGIDDILKGNCVGNQMFFSRSDFIEVGGFDECFPAWQDYDLWIRLIKLKGKAYCTGTQTYIVDQSHVHERISGSKKKWDESLQLFEAKYALDKKYFVYWEISVLEEFKEVRIKDYFRFLLLTSDIKSFMKKVILYLTSSRY